MTDIAAKALREIEKHGCAIEALYAMLINNYRTGAYRTPIFANARLNNEQKLIVKHLIDNNIEDVSDDLVYNKKSGTKEFRKQIIRYASEEAKVYITMKIELL